MINEFVKRRKKLFTQLSDNSISVIFSENDKYRNNDVTKRPIDRPNTNQRK
jgi:hypothetical protein